MKNTIIFFTLLLVATFSVQTLKAEGISGKVLYQGDTLRPIGNVTVSLKNTDNNTVQTCVSAGNGFYEFPSVSNGNYILSGVTNLAGGGVSFYDATMVFLNIIGFYQFSPLEFLASDVNGSGSISWSDYNLIINHILFNTPFPVGPWKFESSSFTISNFKDGVPNGLGGTCSGDVGGTFVPTANATPALPLEREGVINVSTNETFTTRILTHSELSITGAGIIINYPSELLQIETVEFKGNDYEFNIENGQIRLIWGNPNTTPVNFIAGETFITIHGTTTSAFEQGMTANIGLDGNTSLMNESNKELSNLQFASPVISFGNPSLKLSNYPNPFTSSTKLSIYTPENGSAVLEVYNTAGQLIKNMSVGTLSAGFHEVNLDASNMSKGYYICKMHIQTGNTELSQSIRIFKAE